MYLFNVKKYKAVTGDRLCVYDVKNKEVYDYITVTEKNYIRIKDKTILEDVRRFKFKFQREINGKWIDNQKYFALISPNKLSDFWTDKVSLDTEELRNHVAYFINTQDSTSRNLLIKSFKQGCKYLWFGHNKKFNNIKKFINFIEKSKKVINEEFENISLYFQSFYTLQMELQRLNLSNLYYYQLYEEFKSNHQLIKFIKDEIFNLEKSELQFSDLIIGQYYSLLLNREQAEFYFNKTLKHVPNIAKSLRFTQGLNTYKYVENIQSDLKSNLIYYDDYKNNEESRKLTILISVDQRYLRKYLPMLYYSMISLEKYNYHIHVVGNNKNTIPAISEAKLLFTNINSFISKGVNVKEPTFSYEELPSSNVDLKVFSATSRFIIAPEIMKKFNTNLLILDADMFIIDDLNSYINEIKDYDVTIPFSRSATTMQPWRRVMAGNIYLKNNDRAITFIRKTSEYILKNLEIEDSWTLDQNALTYAFEKVTDEFPDIKFANVYEFNRPFTHPQLRNFIEKN